MRLGIDASNISGGGGITHLVNLLGAAQPLAHGFEKVVIWASSATLACLRDEPWLLKRSAAVLEANAFRRGLWQRRELGKLARAEGCDLLFVPGGTFFTDFRPVVTMSRNLLPFQWKELLRYRWSLTGLRLLLLRWSQSKSFRTADATIFLTEHAKEAVSRVTGPLAGAICTIPHGVDESFYCSDRPQSSIDEHSPTDPLQIIYTSIIDLYKHQWHVVEAVAALRAEGLPVSLVLIGPANPAALRRLKKALAKYDPRGEFILYAGAVSHANLPARCAAADLFVFASSCENMPNVLLEGMAAGLPIACSDRGPMPEVLGEAGVYFDPESAASISQALRQLIDSPELRMRKAQAALQRVRQYTWARCATETFAFLATTATDYRALQQGR